MRANGTGTIMQNGYIMHESGGAAVLEHVRVAEKALGKPMPPGAVVHHVDENKQNNVSTNLVICPSSTYHQLIHVRMRALAACGNANWRKCSVCKKYDDPERLVIYSNGVIWHSACNAKKRGYRWHK